MDVYWWHKYIKNDETLEKKLHHFCTGLVAARYNKWIMMSTIPTISDDEGKVFQQPQIVWTCAKEGS